MRHDDFESERYRVERVLEILEHAASRLEARAYIPASLLSDAVEFIRATEDAAYDAAQISDGEPPLSACLDEHLAAREPLEAMQEAIRALERGEPTAPTRFTEAARKYIQLRRNHMRVDDRLFESASRQSAEPKPSGSKESVESASTQQAYDRLVEASAILAVGAPTAFPTATRTRPPTRRPIKP